VRIRLRGIYSEAIRNCKNVQYVGEPRSADVSPPLTTETSPMKPRSWTIRPRDDAQPLAEVVAGILRASRAQAVAAIHQGRVQLQGQVCRQPAKVVRAGQRVSMAADELPRSDHEPRKGKPVYRPKAEPVKEGPKPRIVYQDDTIVVVDKPVGLTTVRHADELAEAGARAQRFLPATLIDTLPGLVKGPTQGRFRLRAVHRLDRDTSGLVVIARNPEAESKLGKQFRDHTIERRYRALVRGVAQEETIESELVRDRGDGRRGSGAGGQKAVTNVRVIEQFPAGALVECQLETGRTHQVRIHLGERSIPLCGERIYDRPLHGQPMKESTTAKRPMLHAQFLTLDHPRTGKRLSWTAEPPADFQACLAELRPATVVSEVVE
jgi:23S rRNA pseudouridine1911/1915/1917 synthase